MAHDHHSVRERQRRYKRRLRERAFAAIGGEICCGCRETSGVQFAHVKPTGLRGRGRGAAERYRDVIRHPHCYAPACEECHRVFDRIAANAESREEIPF